MRDQRRLLVTYIPSRDSALDDRFDVDSPACIASRLRRCAEQIHELVECKVETLTSFPATPLRSQ